MEARTLQETGQGDFAKDPTGQPLPSGLEGVARTPRQSPRQGPYRLCYPRYSRWL